MQLSGKKIILGISGSIAAYKTPELVRQLIKAGATVQVIATPSACEFVSTLALATVSQNEVFTQIINKDQWNNHVHLGRWADLMLIAPCSANTLAKMAHGICDNILMAVYLSATCPVAIAPAMDEDMWLHPATKTNINTIQSYNNLIIAPEHGALASGIVGMGRMAEIENIMSFVTEHFTTKNNNGKKALVTAGATREALDPVRFIGNHATGKMGIALAVALADQGYEVHLVLGASTEQINYRNIHLVRVQSAQEMFDASVAVFPDCEIAIMAAAVADYKPKNVATQKIKKEDLQSLSIELERTQDILAHVGKNKKDNQIVVGFALETNNEIENAEKKRKNKNADFIVLNSLNDKGAGFGYDTNKVTIINQNGIVTSLPLESKSEIAKKIVACILDNITVNE